MRINKELVSYLIFGVLTTLINIVTYGLLSKFMNVDYKIATTIAWIISVFFAFITNKIYVFNSKQMKILIIFKELSSFLFFRLLSYGVDLGLMILLVELLIVDDLIAKILTNIVIIIINYLASKKLVFKTSIR